MIWNWPSSVPCNSCYRTLWWYGTRFQDSPIQRRHAVTYSSRNLSVQGSKSSGNRVLWRGIVSRVNLCWQQMNKSGGSIVLIELLYSWTTGADMAVLNPMVNSPECNVCCQRILRACWLCWYKSSKDEKSWWDPSQRGSSHSNGTESIFFIVVYLHHRQWTLHAPGWRPEPLTACQHPLQIIYSSTDSHVLRSKSKHGCEWKVSDPKLVKKIIPKQFLEVLELIFIADWTFSP